MTNLTIKKIEDEGVWNSFVFKHTNETFHQSWEWGNTYKKLNKLIWRLGVYRTDKLIAVALVVMIDAKRGSFLHIPHGPVFSGGVDTKTCLETLLNHLIALGKERGCGFIRLAPTLKRTQENKNVVVGLGFKKAPIFVQSELSWRLNLDQEIKEILKGMRKSTRYIIKRADKHKLIYKTSQLESGFDTFYQLYEKTVQQQGFHGQGKDFIKKEYQAFLESKSATMYFVYSGDILLSTALVIHQGASGYYHYGASIRTKDNIPAPHLLQWYIIRDLKAREYKYYNFWGIAPENKPKHPWRGLTTFKKGFGGEELEYLQTYDYVLKWSYWINWIVETIRRIKRHY